MQYRYKKYCWTKIKDTDDENQLINLHQISNWYKLILKTVILGDRVKKGMNIRLLFNTFRNTDNKTSDKCLNVPGDLLLSAYGIRPNKLEVYQYLIDVTS